MLAEKSLEEAKSSTSEVATAPRKRKLGQASIAISGGPGIRRRMEDMEIDGNNSGKEK